jgi:hypothetical protein
MNTITFESFAVNDKNNDLLDEAIDAAFGVIQSKFDVKSGSVAGSFLVGPKRASLRTCFRQYIRAEYAAKEYKKLMLDCA